MFEIDKKKLGAFILELRKEIRTLTPNKPKIPAVKNNGAWLIFYVCLSAS